MHFSAASLVLNWANAHPADTTNPKSLVQTIFKNTKKKSASLKLFWQTLWMFCVWVDNDLYVVKLSILYEYFFKTIFLCVKGQVPASDKTKGDNDDIINEYNEYTKE